jgi:tetratricopeptide (TPR) repeat protein/serine/threonine protein kinase
MIGRELGGFKIIEQIGMGGMATVFKAYDPKTERNVAVKILPQQYSNDPTFRTRFENEARAIAKLEHPHILPMFTYGEEDGVSYMVMRYMDTGTLSERIRQKQISLNDASKILRQLADALDYAHANGIIHRDIKPSNVLMDKSGNAYLTDFGIAKIVGGSTGGLDLTGSGIIGTPFYMSPEQCKGEKELSPASDLYSLGVVLYEMVTGHTPYRAETPLAVIQMHLMDTLPPPKKSRPDLPEGSQMVIAKALAKSASDRFTTCMEFAMTFEKSLAQADTAVDLNLPLDVPTMVGDMKTSTLRPNSTIPSAKPDSTLQSATATGTVTIQQAGTSPFLYIMGGLVAIVAIIAAVLLFLPPSTRDNMLMTVGLVAPTATATPTYTPTVTPTVTPTIIPSATPSPTQLAADPFDANDFGVVVAGLGEDAQARFVRDLQGAGMNVLAISETPANLSDAQNIRDIYNASLLIYARSADNQTQRAGFVLREHFADIVVSNQLIPSTITQYEVVTSDDVDRRFWRGLIEGHIQFERGNYEEAISVFNRAESFIPAETSNSDRPLGLYVNRGLAKLLMQDVDGARNDFNIALEISPNNAEVLNNLGVLEHWISEPDAVFDYYNQAIAINPDFLAPYNNRGILYAAQGNLLDAIDDFNTAIGIDAGSTVLFVNRADTLSDYGQYDRAIEDYTSAINIDSTNPDYYVNRGDVYVRSGDPDAGMADYDSAIELDPDNTRAYVARGRLNENQGNFEDARDDYQAALEINPDEYPAIVGLANILYNVDGDLTEALNTYSRAMSIWGEDSFVQLQMGRIFNQLGQHSVAIESLNLALQFNPNYAEAIAELAYAQYRTDFDADSAIAELSRAIAMNDSMAFAYNYRGLIASETDPFANIDQIINDFNRAKDLEPDKPEIYLNAANFFNRIADSGNAIENANRYLQLRPNNVDGLAQLALGYYTEGNIDNAASTAETCTRIDENYAYCWDIQGLIALDAGRYNAALDFFTTAIDLTGYHEFYYDRGRTRIALEDYDLAIEDLTQAIEGNGNIAKYYNQRALAYFRLQDYDNANNDLNSALALGTENDVTYKLLGDIAFQQEDYDSAIMNYTQSLDLVYSNGTLYTRARTYSSNGDYESAIADLQTILENDDSYDIAYFQLGLNYYFNNEIETALDNFLVYLDRQPNDSSGQYYVGLMYYVLEDYERAIEYLNQSIETCTEDCHFHYVQRGLAYYRLGDYARARRDFERSLDVNPNYADAYNGLGLVDYKEGDLASAIENYTSAIELAPDVVPFI